MQDRKKPVLQELKDVYDSSVLSIFEKMEYANDIVVKHYKEKNILKKTFAKLNPISKENTISNSEVKTVAESYSHYMTEYITTVANTLFETARQLIVDMDLSKKRPDDKNFSQFMNHLTRLIERFVLNPGVNEEDKRLLAIECAIRISMVAFENGDLNSVSVIIAALDATCSSTYTEDKIDYTKSLTDLPLSKEAKQFVITWQENYNASTNEGKANLAKIYKTSIAMNKPVIPILASYLGVMEVANNSAHLASVETKKTVKPEDTAQGQLQLLQTNLKNSIQHNKINLELCEQLNASLLADTILFPNVSERKEIEAKIDEEITKRNNDYDDYKKQNQKYCRDQIMEAKRRLMDTECSEQRKNLKDDVYNLQNKFIEGNDSMRTTERDPAKINKYIVDEYFDAARHKHPMRKQKNFADSGILEKYLTKGVYVKNEIKDVKTKDVKKNSKKSEEQTKKRSGSVSQTTSPILSRQSMLPTSKLSTSMDFLRKRQEPVKVAKMGSVESLIDLRNETGGEGASTSPVKVVKVGKQEEETQGNPKAKNTTSTRSTKGILRQRSRSFDISQLRAELEQQAREEDVGERRKNNFN